MLDFGDRQSKMRLAVLAVVVLAVGYFLWTRSAPPEPTIPPGQSLRNPFGTAAPGPGGAPASSPSPPVGPSPSAPYGRR
jgi:hypothetical protein